MQIVSVKQDIVALEDRLVNILEKLASEAELLVINRRNISPFESLENLRDDVPAALASEQTAALSSVIWSPWRLRISAIRVAASSEKRSTDA